MIPGTGIACLRVVCAPSVHSSRGGRSIWCMDPRPCEKYLMIRMVILLLLPVFMDWAKAEEGAATASVQDVTQESPRERNRVLLKRNPIASEYQEPGRLGLSDGASADAEGVDFRSQFRLRPLSGKDGGITRLETNVSYQAASGRVEPGGRLHIGRTLGPVKAQVQISSSSATRLINHYQARWIELPGEVSLLGFPRYSEDSYETDNRAAAWRFDVGRGAPLTGYYEGHASRYTDLSYRNRLEYQIATGGITASTVNGRTITAAAVTDASLRRYFHTMDTTRDIVRHQFGVSLSGERNSIDASVYISRWENFRAWRPFNFVDTGVDLSYRLIDQWVPAVAFEGGYDVFDLGQSLLANHRPSDLLTTDSDYAFRLDWEREAKLFGHKLWMNSGVLLRNKERDIDHERAVFVAAAPLPLAEVVGGNSSASILEDRVTIPAGIDIELALATLATQPGLVSRSDASSFVQTLQEVYTSEEAVGAIYVAFDQRLAAWRWQAGLRFESTRTDTLGTVIGPPDLLAGIEGDRIDRVVIGDDTIMDTFADFDAYRVGDGRQYNNVIPSVALRYEPDEHVSWRLAVFQQLMRPQYFDIVRYRRVNPPTRTISEGNPALEPTLITSFALALEIDSAAWGKLAAEIYHKSVDDFFFDARSVETLDGVLYDVSRVENGSSGSIDGFQVQLDRGIPGFDRGRLRLAYTWSESTADVGGRTIRLPERSRHLFQSGLDLGLGRWTWSTQVSWQSRALDSVGATAIRDVYREDVLIWNNTLRARISDAWSARLQLVNLIDYPERSAESDVLRVTNNQFSDFSVVASVTLEL